jgi:hypothetical protein
MVAITLRVVHKEVEEVKVEAMSWASDWDWVQGWVRAEDGFDEVVSCAPVL